MSKSIGEDCCFTEQKIYVNMQYTFQNKEVPLFYQNKKYVKHELQISELFKRTNLIIRAFIPQPQ